MMPLDYVIPFYLDNGNRASEQIVCMTNQYDNVVTKQPTTSTPSRTSVMFDKLKKTVQQNESIADCTSFMIAFAPNIITLQERLNNIPQINNSVSMNKANILLAHNAESSVAYGAIIPNQYKSVTELLDAGVRGFEFDLQQPLDGTTEPVLRHLSSGYDNVFFQWLMKVNLRFTDAIKEIKEWQNKHTNEHIILNFEIKPAHRTVTFANITYNIIKQYYSDDEVFNFDKAKHIAHGTNQDLPSINDIVNQGKQITILEGNPYTHYSYWNWSDLFVNRYVINGRNAIGSHYLRDNNYNLWDSPNKPHIRVVGEDNSLPGRVLEFFRCFSLVPGTWNKEDMEHLQYKENTIISGDMISDKHTLHGNNIADLAQYSLQGIIYGNSYVLPTMTLLGAGLGLAHGVIDITTDGRTCCDSEVGMKATQCVIGCLCCGLSACTYLPGRTFYTATRQAVNSFHTEGCTKQAWQDIASTTGKTACNGMLGGAIATSFAACGSPMYLGCLCLPAVTGITNKTAEAIKKRSPRALKDIPKQVGKNYLCIPKSIYNIATSCWSYIYSNPEIPGSPDYKPS